MPQRRFAYALVWAATLLLVPGVPVHADDFRVVPSLTVTEEYNDNIFFEERNADNDIITTVSPAIDVVERTERLDLRLNGRLDGVLYARHPEFNEVDHGHSGRMQYQVTPRFSAAARAGYVSDSRPDRDLIETGQVLTAVRRDRQDYALSGTYLLSEKTAATLSYGYARDDYDDPEFENVRTHTIGLGLTRDLQPLLPRTVGRLNIGYAHYEYDDARFDNYTLTAGASHALSEAWNILLDVGVRYTRSEYDTLRLVPVTPVLFSAVPDEETDQEWGGIGQAVVSYAGEFTTVNARLYQELDTSSGQIGTVQRTAFVLDATRRFTEDLRFGFSAGYYVNQSEDLSLPFADTDEQTVRIRPWIRYDVTKDVALEGSYSYTYIEDKQEHTRAHRNLVYIRARVQHRLFQ
jgi:hypothetical protein